LFDEVGVDVEQLADARRRLGRLADLGHVRVDPVAEVARLAGRVEDEHRRALHAVVDDRARHAAGEVEHLDAAVVGGDERALGRRQRDEELALACSPLTERPGEADRHLRHAGEVLDVAPRRPAGSNE
jgi:hypothetical protein